MSAHDERDDEQEAPPAKDPRIPNLVEPVWAECSVCKQKARLLFAPGVKPRIGDVVYVDYNRPFFGRCPRCKRSGTQIVTKTFEVISSPSVTGFWKIPVADGPSSDSKTDSSDKPKE
jgi:hypothetical protein